MSVEIDRVIAVALGDKLETEPDCHRLSDLCPFMHDDLYEDPPCETCEHWYIKPPHAYSTKDSVALEGIKAIVQRKLIAEIGIWPTKIGYVVRIKRMADMGSVNVCIGEGGTLAAALADAMVEFKECPAAESGEMDCDICPLPSEDCFGNWCLKPALKKLLEGGGRETL